MIEQEQICKLLYSTYKFLTQQWVLIIAGWFVVGRINLGTQRKNYKTDLGIKTTYEVIDQLNCVQDRLNEISEYISRDRFVVAVDMDEVLKWSKSLKEATNTLRLSFVTSVNNALSIYESRQIILHGFTESFDMLCKDAGALERCLQMKFESLDDIIENVQDPLEVVKLILKVTDDADIRRRIECLELLLGQMTVELQNSFMSDVFGGKARPLKRLRGTRSNDI